MNHPIFLLTVSQIKEFFREPGAVFWSFGFPILMAVGLGLAFSGDQEILHGVAVVSPTLTEDGKATKILFEASVPQDTVIEKRFQNETGITRYQFHITSWDEAEILLKRGIINAIITENENGLVYHYDPVNPEGELIQMQLSDFFETGDLGRRSGSFAPLDAVGTRYIDFFIPGLLTLGIMMSVMWGVCYSLIEKRSKKLMRRMVATPMRKSHFLISLWASRLMITIFDSLVLLTFAYYFFDVKIQGSLPALILLLLSGNIAFFGLSILLSSRTANMQVGNGLISFITTPMMVLSGIFFSYQNFPDWAINIIKYLPLTRFTDHTRSIINEGAGFLQTLDGIIILLTFGMLTFFMGMKVYKWY
ncbi:MAG: ABC transporter permease [Bacteroidales bacterium]